MGMYGTVARMRVKAGHEEQVMSLQEGWEQSRGPSVDGYLNSYVLKGDGGNGEYWLMAVFRDRESYRRNAEDPAQDREYRSLREHLDADPEWHDGEVVFQSQGGRVARG